MKLLCVLAGALGLAAALPSSGHPPTTEHLEFHNNKRITTRQVETVRNDLEEGNPAACPRVILIYARATGEPGNMGISAGPNLATSLTTTYQSNGGIWVQGVGDPYLAQGAHNFLPLGTTREAIDEGKRLFQLAHTKCPTSVVVAGGYSQGTAVIVNAIRELWDEEAAGVGEQVQGVVLFGYTRNEQNGGKIPGG
ncbi:hypothetical protein VTJ04DRAFT_10324 [Mycothermus thermophilus]|uniref:uncharacterized protein n=1 Tax=Humicola insolens TaxID=85995 RepID=UPI003743429B